VGGGNSAVKGSVVSIGFSQFHSLFVVWPRLHRIVWGGIVLNETTDSGRT
jgi:hypothetical protein